MAGDLTERTVTRRPDRYETDAAFHDLVELLGSLDAVFREGDRALTDDQSVLEGYRWLFSVLQVGLLTQVWADPGRPRFVDIVGPHLKWGGDNADAFYRYAPLDPDRTYRVRGNRGDAAYFSLTVYGGPDDGRWSDRIVGTVNDEQVAIDETGDFEIVLSAEEHPGAWLALEPDAVCAITRDYRADPRADHGVEWHIECLDPPAHQPLTDAGMARRFRAVATWLREQTSIMPVTGGEPNTVDEPYPVPTETVGWAAGDAAYAMGRFALADHEALVVRGRSPACRFWNLCLWNPFLHTYDYDHGRVTINGAQTHHEPDGSWEIVIAGRDPGHPNWIDTQGHAEGLLWFRWFLPQQTPERPTTEVVRLGD